MAAASLRAALRAFHRVAEQAARRAGLTPQQHLLLLMIRGAPDGSGRATTGELVERLQLAQPTVTELARRAELAGLIEREPSTDDARVVHLRVTAEGEKRLRKVFALVGSERETLTQHIAAIDA